MAGKKGAKHSNKTTFKKGVVTNPKGRPPLPPEVRQLNALTTSKYQTVVNKFFHLPISELRKLKTDENLSGLEHAVLSILVGAISKGDDKRLESLLNRTVGKVADKVEISEVEKNLETMSLGEIIEQFEKAKDVLSGAGINIEE